MTEEALTNPRTGRTVDAFERAFRDKLYYARGTMGLLGLRRLGLQHADILPAIV